MPKTPTPPSTPSYIKDKLFSMVSRSPSVALNYVAHVTGISNLAFHSDLTLEQYHSPKAHAKILQDYEAGIKIKGLISPVDEWLKAVTTQLDALGDKATGLEDFKKKIEEDTTLSDADKKTKIDFCIKRETNLNDTRLVPYDLRSFQKRLNVLSELLSKDEINNPRVIVAYIDDEYHKMIKQMDADKTSALAQIGEEFAPLIKAAELSSKLKASELNSKNTSVKELTDMQQGMEKRIKDAYDKAKNDLDIFYEKGTPAATDKDKTVPSLREGFVKKADQAEMELINLVLYAEHTDSKAIPGSTNMVAGAGAAPNATDPRQYREIDFDKYVASQPLRATGYFSGDAWSDYLKFICNMNAELYTPSGLLLKHTKEGISITIPAAFELYHQYNDNQLGSDLLCIMNELKAKGKEEVTISININNPQLREKIIEEAYIAAKLAGFPDDKIKFNISCPEDDKQIITDKTAKEITSRLGNGPSRAQAKLTSWDEQKKAVADPGKFRANVAALDKKINNIVETPLISAATADPDDAPTPSSSFSVRRN